MEPIYKNPVSKNPPQPFSTQAPGAIPEIVLPKVEIKEGIRVFYNKTELENVALLAEDGALKLPMDELSEYLGLSMKGYVDAFEVRDTAKDALVWWDKPHDMVVISTGSYKNDDILRNIGGKLYMNGKPYYEISFNVFDLKWYLSKEYFPNDPYSYQNEGKAAQAEEILKELHERGFSSIRVFDNIVGGNWSLFDEEKKKEYYKMCDKMYDLCDKYSIQVVSSLWLPATIFSNYVRDENGDLVSDGSDGYDLICDPNCPARQKMYEYIDEYVGRYKNRRTILAWEIINEGNLAADLGRISGEITYSAKQIGDFYADCADRIRSVDPERLVTGGDSMIRACQWHLYKATMEGRDADFTTDNLEERLKATYIINRGLDLVSVHGYAVGAYEETMCVYDRGDGTKETVTWKLLKEEAEKLGKILYNGETGDIGVDLDGTVYPHAHPARARSRDRYLTEIIERDIQLTHWWDYRSGREGINDVYTWSVDPVNHDNTLAVIQAANMRIKAMHVINYLWKEEN